IYRQACHRHRAAAAALVRLPSAAAADRVLAGCAVPPARPAGISPSLGGCAMVDTHALPVATDAKQVGRLMRQASLASMSVAIVLVVAKGAAWLVTDSVAMLSSLIDSALDLVSSLITFLAIRQALIPADEDHRFGHGKAEALAGVAQAGFIAASAGGLLLTVVDRFLHPRALQ